MTPAPLEPAGSEGRMCNACEVWQPVSEFYVERDGAIVRRCKRCSVAKAKRWQRQNAERYAAVQRAYQQRKLAAMHAAAHIVAEPRGRVWRARTPAENYKEKARNAVLRAIRKGTLIRPACCATCGKSRRVVGHHDDYDKPLEVRWLCNSCHRQYHADTMSPQERATRSRLRWVRYRSASRYTAEALDAVERDLLQCRIPT